MSGILVLAVALVLGPGTARAYWSVIDAPTQVNGVEGSPITLQVIVNNPDGCKLSFRARNLVPSGSDAMWTPSYGIYTTTTTFTFTWTPTLDDAGDYSLSYIVSAPPGGSHDGSDPCIGIHISPIVRIHVDDAGGEPQFGSVSGFVTADCPTPSAPLYGVLVDVLELGSGNLLGSTVTDEGGNYSIANLPVGSCTVNIVAPLGYSAVTTSNAVDIVADQDVSSDFDLSCQSITPAARTIGFWKHQFAVATGGHGHAQVDGPTLCSYLDLIDGHFNNNAVNQVVIYIPPQSATCEDKLIEGKGLLNLQGSVGMIDRARQQLLALLLNAAAGYVGLFDTASDDGATISQAITYCDNVIDDPVGDYEKAKTIADTINNGGMVPAGMIPLSTANIAYRERALLNFAAGPSPASGHRAFHFAMARPGQVSLRVFDVQGRLVARVFQGSLSAGQHTLAWDGRADDGGSLSSGIYFARLSAGKETLQAKLVQTKR